MMKDRGFILKEWEGFCCSAASTTTLDLKTPLYRTRCNPQDTRFRWTSKCVFDSQKHGRISPSLHVHRLNNNKKTRKNELDSALSVACDPCMIVCVKMGLSTVTFPSPLSSACQIFFFSLNPALHLFFFFFSMFISWRTTCFKGKLYPKLITVAS